MGFLLNKVQREYKCPECNTVMVWEDEWEDVLVCEKCGYSVEAERYGITDEEYDALFPLEEDLE